MLPTFTNFKCIRAFNKLIIENNSQIKYILILPHTLNFQLLNDLNYIFKKKFDIIYYIQLFKSLSCYTMYGTLFKFKEKRKLGPIADDLSFKISVNYLQKFLKSLNNVKIIGPQNFKQKFNVMSYDSFIDSWTLTEGFLCKV